MKRLRSVLSVVMILVSPVMVISEQAKTQSEDKAASKAGNSVKVKYDKKKDLTTVTLKTMPVSSAVTKEVSNLGETTQLDLNIFFTHPGQELKKPAEAAVMGFKSISRYPVYLRGQNLMAVLDGDRAIPLEGTTYSSNSQTFYVEEILASRIPYEIMQRITAAKDVSFFLGVREVKLKGSQLEDLREITRRMSP
jgi:hypothetical protein